MPEANGSAEVLSWVVSCVGLHRRGAAPGDLSCTNAATSRSDRSRSPRPAAMSQGEFPRGRTPPIPFDPLVRDARQWKRDAGGRPGTAPELRPYLHGRRLPQDPAQRQIRPRDRAVYLARHDGPRRPDGADLRAPPEYPRDAGAAHT